MRKKSKRDPFGWPFLGLKEKSLLSGCSERKGSERLWSTKISARALDLIMLGGESILNMSILSAVFSVE